MTAPVTAAASAQASQTGLAVVLGYDLERAWNQLDVSSLRKTLPDFTLLIAALVHKYGAASRTLAARFYKAQRAAAGLAAPFTVIPAALTPLPQVGSAVDWATRGLWATEPDIASAQTLVRGAAEKMVLDVGRDTIVNNVHRDRKALGWVRVTEPDPCAFCALLATRGAVYRGRGAGFPAHDHCRCHADPIFTAYEPSAEVREWQKLYRDSTTGGNAARTRREWRRAFDARTK